MKSVQDLFKEKERKILSIYFTAGYPSVEALPDILLSLQSSGVDLVEVGLPFSDPIADGPVIQESNKAALDSGATVEKIFAQLEKVAPSISMPLVIMSYFNPLISYGLERLCEQCKLIGITQLIIPDLPIEEYQLRYKEVFKKYGLSLSFLVTPLSSDERIRLIDSETDGFIYAVSSPGVTGGASSEAKKMGFSAYISRLVSMNLKNKFLVGFGIRTAEDRGVVDTLGGAGVIIGSRFIEIIEQEGLSGIVPYIETL